MKRWRGCGGRRAVRLRGPRRAEAPPAVRRPVALVAGSFEALLDGLVRRGADTPQASLAAGAARCAGRSVQVRARRRGAGCSMPRPAISPATAIRAGRRRRAARARHRAHDSLAEAAAARWRRSAPRCRARSRPRAARAERARRARQRLRVDALAMRRAGRQQRRHGRPAAAGELRLPARLAGAAHRRAARRRPGRADGHAAGLASSRPALALARRRAARQAQSTAALGSLRCARGRSERRDAPAGTRRSGWRSRWATPCASERAGRRGPDRRVARRPRRGAAGARDAPCRWRARPAPRLEAQLLSNLTDV